MGVERAGFEIGHGEFSGVDGGGGRWLFEGGGVVGVEEGGEGVEEEGGEVRAVEGVGVEMED